MPGRVHRDGNSVVPHRAYSASLGDRHRLAEPGADSRRGGVYRRSPASGLPRRVAFQGGTAGRFRHARDGGERCTARGGRRHRDHASGRQCRRCRGSGGLRARGRVSRGWQHRRRWVHGDSHGRWPRRGARLPRDRAHRGDAQHVHRRGGESQRQEHRWPARFGGARCRCRPNECAREVRHDAARPSDGAGDPLRRRGVHRRQCIRSHDLGERKAARGIPREGRVSARRDGCRARRAPTTASARANASSHRRAGRGGFLPRVNGRSHCR